MHVCVWAHACAHTCQHINFGGQSHLPESVLFNCVGQRDRTHTVKLDWKHLYLLNHIAGPTLLLESNINGLLATTTFPNYHSSWDRPHTTPSACHKETHGHAWDQNRSETRTSLLSPSWSFFPPRREVTGISIIRSNGFFALRFSAMTKQAMHVHTVRNSEGKALAMFTDLFKAHSVAVKMKVSQPLKRPLVSRRAARCLNSSNVSVPSSPLRCHL